MRVRFAGSTFDSETRQLVRKGAPVHLSPKAFRLLELLLESRPKALSKAQLQERIWPDTFVSEANLASLAAEIREAIGEDGRSAQCVRTVYGFGYAFSGEAVEVEATPRPAPGRRHVLLDGGREIALGEGENVVGRDVDAAVRIDDSTVSRHHARLVADGAEVSIEDLDSKNGTFVDGKRLRPARPAKLKSGAALKFGSVLLTFRTHAPDTSTDTVRGD
jgi:DNA-binding winged helix-turn-helix (wHTH) protein